MGQRHNACLLASTLAHTEWRVIARFLLCSALGRSPAPRPVPIWPPMPLVPLHPPRPCQGFRCGWNSQNQRNQFRAESGCAMLPSRAIIGYASRLNLPQDLRFFYGCCAQVDISETDLFMNYKLQCELAAVGCADVHRRMTACFRLQTYFTSDQPWHCRGKLLLG